MSHRKAARGLARIASSTGCRSNGERLMTLSTSAVAVCCCSDSASRRVRCLHLVEQPHILDRDHGLVGEGLQQLDLLVAERPHLGAAEHDGADRFALPQQRNAERCVRMAAPSMLPSANLVSPGPLAHRQICTVVPSSDRAADCVARSGSAIGEQAARSTIGSDRDATRQREADLAVGSSIDRTSASQSSQALSTMPSAPAAGRSAKRLITLSMSAVAVWCSSASVRSRVLACTSSNSRDVLDGDHRLVGEGL